MTTTTTSNFYYYHNDHLSGTSVVTDEAGNLVEVRDYYPYGESRVEQQAGNHQASYGFTGKEQDSQTGLQYFGARYYSPFVGRFAQIDPAALFHPEKFLKDPQQLNTYSYAKNNPLVYVDPSGEIAFLAPLLVYGVPIFISAVSTASLYAHMIPAMMDRPETTARLAPGTSTAIDAKEFITGKDAFTGSPLSNWEQVTAGAGVLLPISGSGIRQGNAFIRGFKSTEQFNSVLDDIKKAVRGADDATIGIRGSAVTGKNWETGKAFSQGSDIDFFVVSDKLYQEAIEKGARVNSKGFLSSRDSSSIDSLRQLYSKYKNDAGLEFKPSFRIYSQKNYEQEIKDSAHVLLK